MLESICFSEELDADFPVSHEQSVSGLLIQSQIFIELGWALKTDG